MVSESQPAFDLSFITMQWGDVRDEVFRSVLAFFVDDVSSLSAEMHAAVAAGQMTTLLRATHTLRGAAANVGAMTLAASVAALEDAASDGLSDQLDGRLADMQAASDRVLEVIAAGGP
jgi:HPt (histidine-containing phosphotransfer) domain-containing protein